MENPMLIDTTTEFGARVERKLGEEIGIWLVTVGSDGTPQPNPIWFVWDAGEILFYSQPNKAKLRHIARHPRVALHFEGGELSEDVIVLSGDARIVADAPPLNEVPAYLEKYAEHITRINSTVEAFAASYSVAVRVRPTKVRGW
jgi:PPOX class probable F420-dependent enzyme